MTEILWPMKPKIFTTGPFMKEICRPLLYVPFIEIWATREISDQENLATSFMEAEKGLGQRQKDLGSG